MFIERTINPQLKRLSKQYPVITITGPRQSGKTTLCRQTFPKKQYLTMENINTRQAAQSDPERFIRQLENGAIIDEIQRTPELLSAIQTYVDEKNKEGLFILTGSHQFQLMNNISQSLAGRTAILQLLPFTYHEIYAKKRMKPSLEKLLYTGFYPRIFDKKLNPTEALSFYTTTYIERDIRELINIKDLSKFTLFLKLCAARTGQIINFSNIGNDCGVNYHTIKSWLSILETSYIITLLRPHYENFKKRLIKTPKLYFIDTGLASLLLEIQNETQLRNHPLRGALFESFVVSELLKHRYNNVQTNNLYFFRDNIGNEVDILFDQGIEINPIEIKSSETITSDFFKGLDYYKKLSPEKAKTTYLIYGGTQTYTHKQHKIVSIPDIPTILAKL